jgi:triacylglycerol lipase
VLVFVHGINGSSANFRVMAERLVADGWPREHLYLFDAADPSWGCNVDNAAAIAALVARAREETCAARVDLVAHSMGTLSSRWFMKFLGGHEVVNTYVTLGGMHHGLSSPCWAPDFLGVCVWQELCATGEVIEKLNADPAIAGAGHWVSIYGTGDSTVPNESSHLEGAENIAMPGVEHSGAQGLLEDEATYLEVRRVLGYPCW